MNFQSIVDIMGWLDWLALGWFLACWIGYTAFARIRARKVACIANQLSGLRRNWLAQMISREMRIADLTGLGILQRNVTFFASTTIFIIAGLLTVLGASEKAIKLISALPIITDVSPAIWEVKVLLLVVSFVYAFFKFSWAVRQYNFALVMFGCAPTVDNSQEHREQFVENCDLLLTRANNSFNFGLRAYTFAMAGLAWFLHPTIFILVSGFVVYVLYRREFRSETMQAMHKVVNLTAPR